MDHPGKFSPRCKFAANSFDLFGVLDIANVNFAPRQELRNCLATRFRANDVNDLGSGFCQLLSDDVSDAFLIRYAKNGDALIFQTKKIHSYSPPVTIATNCKLAASLPSNMILAEK